MEWPIMDLTDPLPQVLHLCKKYIRGPLNQGKMNQFSFCLVSAIWSPSLHTFFFLIEVWSIYNVVFISAIQQSASAIHLLSILIFSITKAKEWICL